ncbi:Peptidase C48, SUMO/Sentrin/Ubl1 [Cynara cardunculus var. scolymus]|uniref:Peptidase C48, SUMO/Sentrin/Ubl1 n=1 Tax=Cynara cardunculus var. scolymus TaxID=59895 RepID=A0A118K6R8_CYNCS|nr:Peptidase C48, SUMO/Sentrin/Ubl1 [Cynara cardunculus var. scolymus]
MQFFPTPSQLMLSDMRSGKMSDKERYGKYYVNVTSAISRHRESLSFKNIDLVFFAIVEAEHFYLLRFNLKRVAFVVIDNMSVDISSETKYSVTPSILCYHSMSLYTKYLSYVTSYIFLSYKTLFVEYLSYISHKKADAIDRTSLVRLKMKWRTNENSIGCGIFVMCHMETYMGQSVGRLDYLLGKVIALADTFDGIDREAQKIITTRSLAT